MQTKPPTKPNKQKASRPTPTPHDGRRRVVVEHLAPQVENGRYPAKRIVGEPVHVQADVYGDGHDKVKATALYRRRGDQDWQRVFMSPGINDRWTGTFIPEEQGFYEFTVRGYVDHFGTWQYGLRKKWDANQDVLVELLIGAEMIEQAANNATKADKQFLKDAVKSLKSADDDTVGEAVITSLSDRMSYLMEHCYQTDTGTTYPEVYSVEVERKKALFSSWYEFFPRSASREPGRHGTFKDARKRLPRVAEMGFDVVYFPPIHPIGKKNRKGLNNAVTAQPGDPGSCWAIGSDEGGHKAIHPELGTLDDFKALLKAAEKLDIEIALDIAFQCAPDHPWVTEHPQWFKWRPDGTVQYAENPPKKYEDILPINFETEDWENLWQELKSVFEYWIEQGVLIFRVDNPHTKAFPFWEWCLKEIRTAHPDVIFLAEAFTRPRVMQRLAKIGYTQSYTYFSWRNTPYELREYMIELTQGPMREYFRPNFWPNTPDILTPTLVYGGEPAHLMRVILAATLSSNYGLYGPVYELGVSDPYPGKEEYIDSEKYEIKHWDWDAETRTREVITLLNKFRKENPALQTTYNVHFAESENDQLLCYGKYDEASGNVVLVAVNMDPYNMQSGHVRWPLQELGLAWDRPFQLYDMLSDSYYTWQGEWNYVSLNPYLMPAHVFRVTQQ
jgi:starch synthase (maltosyl-transferring)